MLPRCDPLLSVIAIAFLCHYMGLASAALSDTPKSLRGILLSDKELKAKLGLSQKKSWGALQAFTAFPAQAVVITGIA